MKVLLLGSGGREHAIAWKLLQSPKLEKLWCAPGSDAIAFAAEPVGLDALDAAAVARFAKERSVDLVFIGPEAPLAAGVSDAVRAAGIPAFGPSKAAARLESSKAFAKEFMARHGIPTARSRACAGAAEAKAAAQSFGWSCAVKADGLAAGKGVIVCDTQAECESAADALASTPAGRALVVEERLEGPELTVMALMDGRGWAALPPSRDHKRLLDADAGPNTGGMGALAPAPLAASTWEKIAREVLDRACEGLKKDGVDYRGALYAGLMITADGPKVIEFNARFGDPETQAVLPLLDGDLLALAMDCAQGRLKPGVLALKPGACVGVTLASPGYPDAPKTGARLELSGVDGMKDVLLFHAGTKRVGKAWMAAGGRVLTVVGQGPDLAAARERAYQAVARLDVDGLHYRKDIAASSLRRAAA